MQEDSGASSSALAASPSTSAAVGTTSYASSSSSSSSSFPSSTAPSWGSMAQDGCGQELAILEHYLLPFEQNNLQPGTHVYSFTFQIPMIELPSSFVGKHGNVVYQLEAKLHRPWHLPNTSVKGFTVINPVNIQSPELLAPQMASKNKTVCCLCCASGPIALNARIERRAFTIGESIRIFAEIENGSTRTIRPKAYIQQKQTFYAEGNEMFYVKKIVSVEGEPFFSGKTGTWSGELPKIPLDTSFSIQNCQILKVEYLVVVRMGVFNSLI
ncbi:ARRD3 protein, partial [Amia calva]|nr:ARRD3 protein [Amia calva]